MTTEKTEKKSGYKKIKPAGDSTPGPASTYNPEIAAWVCEIVATHAEGLYVLHAKYRDQGFPHADTIANWRYKHPEFRAQFLDAKSFQADLYAEDTIRIADDITGDLISTDRGIAPNSAAVARARLQIDTRKWHASKLSPKTYGDKSFVESKVTMSHEEMLKELE